MTYLADYSFFEENCDDFDDFLTYNTGSCYWNCATYNNEVYVVGTQSGNQSAWACTPAISIPNGTYSVDLAVNGYRTVYDGYGYPRVPSDATFKIYISETDQHPSGGGYVEAKNITFVDFNAGGESEIEPRDEEASQSNKKIYVNLNSYKGKTIYIGFAYEQTSAEYMDIEFFFTRISVYQYDKLSTTYIDDYAYTYMLRERGCFDIDFNYNLKEYQINDMMYSYDLLGVGRYMSDLSMLYSLYGDTYENDYILVPDTLPLVFQLLSIKEPSNVLIQGRLDVTNINIGQNAGDFCCSVDFTTKSRDFYENVYLPFIDTEKRNLRYYIKLTLGTEQINLIIEDMTSSLSFYEKEWSFSGRTLQCLLDDPYGFKYKYVKPKQSTGFIELSSYLNSIWRHAEERGNYFKDLILTNLPKNRIPVDELDVNQKSYIDIITELCDHFELMLIPHYNGDMEIKRKREWIGVAAPVLPGLPIIDHVVTDRDGIEVLDLQEDAREWKNRIKILGEKNTKSESLSVAVKDTDPKQEMYPGNTITLEVYSNVSDSASLWCNVGSFGTGEVVRYAKADLSNKFIEDEETQSISKIRFKTQYPISIAISRVFCLDDRKYYTVESINDNTQEITLTKELPYEDSHLRYSYYAKYFGDIEYTLPLFETSDIIIRAWTLYSDTITRLSSTWGDAKIKIFLESDSVPAQSGSYVNGRVYTNLSILLDLFWRLYANRGSITKTSSMIDAELDPGIPEDELDKDEKEWRPTLEEIEDQGFLTYIKFRYVPPNLVRAFEMELLELPDEDEIHASYGQAEDIVSISLTEPEDWEDEGIALFCKNTWEYGESNTVPIYIATNHEKDRWSGIKIRVCKDDGTGYTISHDNLIEVASIPKELTDEVESRNADLTVRQYDPSLGGSGIRVNVGTGSSDIPKTDVDATWDEDRRRLLCGKSDEVDGYKYFYKLNVNMYERPSGLSPDHQGVGDYYPLDWAVHFYHIRRGEAVASATANLTTTLPTINMQVIVDPNKESYTVDGSYDCTKFVQYVYLVFNKPVRSPMSFSAKLCRGQNISETHASGCPTDGCRNLGSLSSVTYNSKVLPVHLRDGDQELTPCFSNGRIHCSCTGSKVEQDEIAEIRKYRVSYEFCREYEVVFVCHCQGKDIAFGSVNFSEYENGYSGGGGAM